jgi:hypothetical protein
MLINFAKNGEVYEQRQQKLRENYRNMPALMRRSFGRWQICWPTRSSSASARK